MPVADIGGYKAGYVDKGEGDLIVFAHCSLGYSGFWKGVIAELSDTWRCISIDLPGHAQSDRGNQDISLQHQAIEYVLGLADMAGVKRFHAVGLSLGGAIMTRLAHHHPARVRSLAAFEPILFHFLHNWAPEEIENDRKVMGPVREAANNGRPHEAARIFMEGWGQPGQYDKMPKAGQDAIATALTHVACDFPWGSQWPEGQITEEDITRIDKPVLLGEGETTHNSAKVVNRELAKLFPKVESCVVKGAGHLSAVDDPKQVATLIRTHLENAEVAGY